MALSDHRLLSPPREVWWAGFRSTTAALQQAGWDLSAEQDMQWSRIRLAMRHKDCNLYGISEPVPHQFMRDYSADYRGPPFVFRWLAGDCVVNMFDDLTKFNPIDARPQFTEMARRSIKDFELFAAPMARTEEIIVEPQDVSAMLDRIREMQAPGQAALRQKQRRNAVRDGMMDEQPVPRQILHAQILSIADRMAA